MSLATRCDTCNTVFRVVQDQLKVSEGWVRCGRCGHVFNALEGLFDLGRDGPVSAPTPLKPMLSPAAPPDTSPPPPLPLPPAPSPLEALDEGADTRADVDDEPADDRGDTRIEARDASTPDLSQPFAVDSRPDEVADSTDRATTVADDSGDPADIDTAQALDTGPSPPQTPGFLRAAERAAQWQRPRVRAALAVAAALAAIVLATQVLVHHRDDLAAQHPGLAGPLAALCELLGCTVGPPRHIEALAVDASGLARIEGGSLHKLQITLRNRHPTPVLAPAIELSLTDARSELLARRVLVARDFGAALPERVAAGAELQLAVVLDLGELRVAGYTVELFYP
ncbi:MAG TPA: zinc-ribbon and DUF3426 domain-containing protein [Burkholderiaceae bacterium]|nr:zinc-ribbon and DUF3426 domain-containing protein [Burkholderiaceae bacterium]